MACHECLKDSCIDCEYDVKMTSLNEPTTIPNYIVKVAKMKESHRETYWVILDRSDRPKAARPWDVGRITPFMHENKEYAELEAEKWAKFLGVSVTK